MKEPTFEDKIKMHAAEKAFQWMEWIEKIPKLKFKEDWEIKVIPPFAGAICRFRVEKETASVSIYLDCYDILGYYGSPYWEMYPDSEDEPHRFSIEETDDLLNEIEESLEEQILKTAWLSLTKKNKKL